MRSIVIVVFILAFSISSADDTPYNFIRFNSTARAAAMSNAVVSIENDASLLFFNPALLQTADENHYTLLFQNTF